MRFDSKTRMLAALALLSASGAVADLRLASTPKTGFSVIQQKNSVPFVSKRALYMEPSTFGYQGLENQKKNNYDQFLRSNIDNEQDNRNFVTEDGKDHLPFRTLEGATTGEALTLTIGQTHVVPLRWNNPHASECEFNVWIAGNSVVVPIKRPVCCGEGYQDNAIGLTIPADFNKLVSKVPGFNGCNKVGDCTLQLYAHSVEPRTYASAVPLILQGGDNIATLPKARAGDRSQIAPATQDPGLDLAKLPRRLCLRNNNGASNVESAVPRAARLVSDVANHAYQNSNYSPYSGQQHESISRNLQAAAVLSQVVSNFGELGKSTLTRAQTARLNAARATVEGVIKRYEGTANAIINRVSKAYATTGTVGNTQKLATAFRAINVGATSSNRIQTATYIPSFRLMLNDTTHKKALAADRASLISGDNVVQIYEGALQNPVVSKLIADLACEGFAYKPAALKNTVATAAHPTKHRKLGADGKADQGQNAAAIAYRTGLAKGIQQAPASCKK